MPDPQLLAALERARDSLEEASSWLDRYRHRPVASPEPHEADLVSAIAHLHDAVTFVEQVVERQVRVQSGTTAFP